MSTSPRWSTAGDPLERYVYSPYGVLAIYDATWSNLRAASSQDVEYTYTGRRLDAETGMYYWRHRVYHAFLGRFASRDPTGNAGGVSSSVGTRQYRDGMNLYQYVRSMAVSALDPTGLSTCCCCCVEDLDINVLHRDQESGSVIIGDEDTGKAQFNFRVTGNVQYRRIENEQRTVHI